ncbi:hypothetical protein [Jiella avicenniae]|uniref:Response regulatory domain-containing protein n=1 Tax=Jiella avicenniae TaxID=2907202 RepID=A0A9X1T6F6_9HYPH|nr:hypothetical protein [Jiella avicenniae]MCE7029320.1 hypothetical protein [Jiella avicenniae]
MFHWIVGILFPATQPKRTPNIGWRRKGKLMTILILEDEPIIAVDLEEIVCACQTSNVVVAATLADALRYVAESGGDIDFALLDLQLGRDGSTSLPLARMLMHSNVPFCFVSATTEAIPSEMDTVPQIAKPFEPAEIEAVLPLAA